MFGSEANSVRESHPTIVNAASDRPVGKATGVGFLSSPLTRDDGMPSSGPMMTTDGMLGVHESPSRPEDDASDHIQLLADALAFRDQLMGILGHDLRNPLSAITALAKLTMQRDDLPGDVRERLVQMDRAAKRSLAMIESLLDFSESRWKGALPIRPVVARPADIAARVIEELSIANPDRIILLDLRGREPFELDPVRIEQVLSNLVGNALVHGAADTPIEVFVDVREHEALMAVTNRGPVIPPERAGALFQPFTQGRAAFGNGDRPRGLGLGLYIVRQIVTAHGGTVTVDSSAALGTTFVVHLPRRAR
jgi:signal transduction histidine kinase